MLESLLLSLRLLLRVDLLSVELHRDGVVVLRLRLGMSERVGLLVLLELLMELLLLLLLLVARGGDRDRQGRLAT